MSRGHTMTAEPSPYYADPLVTLYLGDCREVAPALAFDSVLADPPYGVGWNTDPDRSRGGPGFPPITGDDEPFDPAWMLALERPLITWGANHYASALPDSPSWLVWDKRPSGHVNDQADCEMAWSNLGGPARMFRKAWQGGGTLARENGTYRRSWHPTQKPVALMGWCLEKLSGTVLDPYTGSGSTLVAAKQLGRKAIGIEIEERYCEAAAIRLSQGSLFEMAEQGRPA